MQLKQIVSSAIVRQTNNFAKEWTRRILANM